MFIKKLISVQYGIPGNQSTPLTKPLYSYKAKAKICLFFILVPFMWHFFCTKQNILKTLYIQRSEIIIRQKIINAIYYDLGYHYAFLHTLMFEFSRDVCMSVDIPCNWQPTRRAWILINSIAFMELQRGWNIKMKKNPWLQESKISATKRDDLLIHAPTWTNLENFMLSEIIQTHKGKYSMIPVMWNT